MKRKFLAMLSLVLVLALVPTFVFGAKSKENNGGGSDREDNYVSTVVKPGTGTSTGLADGPCQLGTGPAGTCHRHGAIEVKTLADGTIISTTGATRDNSGTWYRLAINRAISNGTMINTNHLGGVAIGNVHVHFANDYAEIAGLPEYIVDDIVALNSGKTASEVFGMSTGVDLTGYEKIGSTRAVILTDQTTGLTNTGTEFIVEVEPLDPTGTFAVVYYDNHTNLWNFMPVTVDPNTKLINMYLPGSCTIQLLRKN